jgi:hypothetical protein
MVHFRNDVSGSLHAPVCGLAVRGALAGNGGTMAGKTVEPKEKKSQGRKSKTPAKARTATGTRRRAAAKARTEEPKELEQKRKPNVHVQGDSGSSVPGETDEDGAERLRAAVNHELARKAGKIALKLAAQAAAGNTASTKILVQLMGDKKTKSPQRKKRSGPSEAQLLELEKEWDSTAIPETEATAL